MDTLRTYLNQLGQEQQKAFADRCGTTVGYLRKAVSTKQKIGESLCINIERESVGVVRCESLRPDVDWAYVRASSPTTVETPAPRERAAACSRTSSDRRTVERRYYSRRQTEPRPAATAEQLGLGLETPGDLPKTR